MAAAKDASKGASNLFASPEGMIFINSLFNLSSISKLKRTITIPASSEKYLSLKSSGSPISKEIGVEILTMVPRNSDRAVAEAPII